MTTSARVQHARQLFAGLPRDYDRMASLLSLGQDARWRRFMVSRVPGEHARVLDVAAGTGLVTAELVQSRGPGRVVALDQSEAMLRRGRRSAAAGDRVSFVLGQAERLPFPDDSFDALTFTYLLRYVDDPTETLRELARVVRPGGTIASLEFHVPRRPVVRAAWWVHTRLVLPVVGLATSRAWYEVGRFLGPSISAFVRRHPLAAQVQMWQEAGIEAVGTRVMSLGGSAVMWGRVRG